MTARRSTHDHWQQRNFCCQKFCSACVEWCRSSPKLGVASIGNKLHIRSQILVIWQKDASPCTQILHMFTIRKHLIYSVKFMWLPHHLLVLWVCEVIRQHHCSHEAICAIRHFKLLFHVNAKCICKRTTPVYYWDKTLPVGMYTVLFM